MPIFLISIQALLLLVLIKLLRRPQISRVLSISLLVFAVIWYITPVLLSFLFWDSRPQQFVEYDVFISHATLESLVLLFTLLFLLVKKPYYKSLLDANIARVNLSPSLTLLIIFASIFSTFLFARVVSEVMGTSYLELNAFAVTAEGTDAYNNIGALAFVQTLLTCFCCACFMVSWPRTVASYLMYAVTIIWLVISTVLSLLGGSRVSLLLPFILFLINQTRQWSKKKLLVLVAAGVFTFIVGGVLAIIVGQQRGGEALSVQDISTKSVSAIDGADSATDLGQSILIDVFVKFDSFSPGAVLLDLGFDSVGWQPYWGSLLAVVPRAILPSKPVPCSADGTYLGHPSRVAAVAMGFSPESGNVGVSPAAVSMWHFGYAGLIGLVVCNILQLYLINSLSLSNSVLLKALALYLIGVPSLATIFVSPDFIIMNVERVVMTYCLIWVAYKMIRHFNSRALSLPSGGAQPALYSGRRADM